MPTPPTPLRPRRASRERRRSLPLPLREQLRTLIESLATTETRREAQNARITRLMQAIARQGEALGETPLATLHRLWRSLDEGERLAFLRMMLTPRERRLLCLGLEEEEG